MKILIIDPDEYYHRLLERELQHLGELIFMRSAKQAELAAAAAPPDLLITELFLEKENGYQVLQKFRKEQGPHIPVIIFTKVDHLEDMQEALGLGVTGYFIKGQNTVDEIKNLILNYV